MLLPNGRTSGKQRIRISDINADMACSYELVSQISEPSTVSKTGITHFFSQQQL